MFEIYLTNLCGLCVLCGLSTIVNIYMREWSDRSSTSLFFIGNYEIYYFMHVRIKMLFVFGFLFFLLRHTQDKMYISKNMYINMYNKY